jgi:hypothetical protein
MSAIGAVAAVIGLLAGCSALGPSTGDATATVTAFGQALDDSDGSAACELLNEAARDDVESSTDADCATGILTLDVGGSVDRPADVYGRSALVQARTGSVFLTVVGSSWKIRAAGCTPIDDEPFDCRIQGD